MSSITLQAGEELRKIDSRVREYLREAFRTQFATDDGKTALIDGIVDSKYNLVMPSAPQIDANRCKSDVDGINPCVKSYQFCVNLHPPGSIITLEDGRRYEVDDAGKWIRRGRADQ